MPVIISFAVFIKAIYSYFLDVLVLKAQLAYINSTSLQKVTRKGSIWLEEI